MTRDELKAIVRYDPTTGIFCWIKTRSRGALSGDIAGHIPPRFGYRIIGIKGRYYKAHRLAWLYVHGEMPTGSLDHINRDKADSRIANLRIATGSENQGNRGFNKNNSTGYRGVVFHRRLGKYQASIRVGFKPKHLGTFNTAVEAGAAAARARSEAFRSFAPDYDTAMLKPSDVTVDALRIADVAREIIE